MFKTRLISGIILVIILLATVGLGGYLLWVVLAAASLIGLSELYHVVKIRRRLPGFVGYGATLVFYILLIIGKPNLILPLLVLLLMSLMGVYVFTYPAYKTPQIVTAFFGVFYVAVMLSYVYQTRSLPQGKIFVWLIFLSSWGCDTCAYCVGMLIGKHKMAPILSPKKSVEGGVGGIVGAALLGVIYGICVNHFAAAGINVALCGLICGVGGAISQIGDLCASAIKRNYDIKDYGTLIPGHGGILDRFDSVIFTAPIIYYLALLLS